MKKRILAMLLAFALAAGMLPVPAARAADGVTDISTAQELAALAGQNLSGSYRLTDDIDMSGQTMAPIANLSGTFDGAGHKITGLTIVKGSGSYTGFFGELSGGAVVQDLVLENCSVTSSSGNYPGTGGLVGKVSGSASILRCGFSGTVENTASGASYTGGLIGYSISACTVESSYARATVATQNAGTSAYTGGFIGYTSGARLNITDCYAVCDVTTKSGKAAGFANMNPSTSNKVTVSNGYAAGNAASSASNSTYGFAYSSVSSGFEFENCYYLSDNMPGFNRTAAGLTEKSSAELQALAAVLGSGFKDDEGVNNGYPILVWQTGEAIDPDAQYTVAFSVKPAAAVLTWNGVVQPAADDGEYVFTVKAGEYSYSVDYDEGDYAPQSGTVKVTRKNVEQAVELALNPHLLRFTLKPADASLSVQDEEGKLLSPTEAGGTAFLVVNGTYSYTAGQFGYEQAGGSLTVNRGDKHEAVTLTALPMRSVTFVCAEHNEEVRNGSLTVTTVDGLHTISPTEAGGMTYELPVGYTYRYFFRASNYSKVEGSISANAEGAETVTLPMDVKTGWDGESRQEPSQVNGIYQIGSGDELAWLAQEVNAGRSADCSAVLTADIDLGEENPWTPIGTSGNPFKGSFDGQGHTVKNLYINNSSGDQGLFGNATNCIICNVTVEGSITAGGSGYASGVGGLVGTLSGYSGSVLIENCVNRAHVSGNQNVAGIAGLIQGSCAKTIQSCANFGNITAVTSNAGGLVGNFYYKCTLQNSYNCGMVSSSNNAGGIAGLVNDSNALVQNCYTTSTAAIGKKNSGTVDKGSVFTLGGSDTCATAKTETEMKSAAFTVLLGEDWVLAAGHNDGYPILGFQLPRYEVSFTVEPAEATVNIDGFQGSQSGSTWSFRLPEGSYSYTVSAYGYEEVTGTVAVTGGAISESVTLAKLDTKNVSFKLSPDTASLTVTCRGKTISPTNGNNYELPYGEYHYLAKAKGYARQEADFIVSADSANVIAVTLAVSTQWDGESVDEVAPNSDGVYEIGSGAELAWLARQVNGGVGKNYRVRLTGDIDLGDENWTPIGTAGSPFAGSFDGDGYTVSGLEVTGAQYAGLFGYVKGASSAQRAEIKNLVVQGSVGGTGDAGGIAGRADNTDFSNCGNEASVTAAGSSTNAGGIVGRQHSYGSGITISGCYNAGDVTAVRAGGIIASVNDEAAITRCYNTGAIAGSGYAGGIRGQAGSMIGAAVNCYNTGAVTGTTSGPIQAGSSTAGCSNCYYLGDSGEGAMTLATMQAGLLEKLGDGWKQAPGANRELPVLAWQKTETPAGEAWLADNVRFDRELAPTSDEDEPRDVPTGALSWDAAEDAGGYAIALWRAVAQWNELEGAEKQAFDSETDPGKKLRMIDADAVIAAMSADQQAAAAPLTEALLEAQSAALMATSLEEFKAADKRVQQADRERAVYILGEIAKGGLPVGYYTTRLERAAIIPDVKGPSFDCTGHLARLEEGIYYATVSVADTAGQYSLPERELAEEVCLGYQDPYNRMQPVTGLRWEGTVAKWDGKAGFTANQAYFIDLYTVKNGQYAFFRQFAVGGHYTSANLGNVFAANTSYAFKVTAAADETRGLSDSMDSGFSPVYTPQTHRPEDREWVDIGSAEEWIALANVQDVPSAGSGSESRQAVAWNKNYRLTADLDFSTLSAADQAKTKSIGNVTNRFMGELDGQGHKITGLTLSNLDSGLFWYIGSTGVVHDLTIEKANVLFSDNAAVLAQNNYGVIENCAVVNCNITADTGAVLGGMVSRNYGEIRYSYVQGGSLTSNSATVTGHAGFAGANEEGGLIENCWTSMKVSTQSDYSGGFVGLGYGGTIRNCFALGDVSARSYSGGFAGRSVFPGNAYENCYAAGTVTVTGAEGNGFIGGNKPDSGFQYDQSQGVVNCYYNGAVNSGHPYGAAGKTRAQMQSGDFVKALGLEGVVWTRSADKNDGLPYLVGVPAPESQKAENITVSITLAVYDKQSYRFSQLGKSISVTVASTGNTRVVDLMDEAAAQGLLTYSYKTTATFGRFIHTINGYAVDEPDGWMFTVNGRLSNVSASLAALEDGDRLLWFEGTTENRFLPPTEEELAGVQVTWIDIGSVEELMALTDPGADLSANYRLTADLNLGTARAAFPGIGTAAAPFTGTFDGQGHTISGASVAGAENVGFFNAIKGAAIKNLNLADVRVTGTNRVGALVGHAQAELDKSDMAGSVASLIGNCSVSGTVSGAGQTGGLVGLNDGAYDKDTLFSVASAVDKCRADVAVTAAGPGEKIGGLAGENRGVITKSASLGVVTAADGTSVGGFTGSNTGDIYDSHASGDVAGQSTVGGFAGHSSGLVKSCYSLGDVSGESYTGGFAGSISAAENVVSAGRVTVAGSSMTGYNGGFAGQLNGSLTGVASQITVKNAYGNTSQADGATISLIGNSVDFTSDAQKAVLEQMTLDTNDKAGAQLYEMFGVNMKVPEALEKEAAKYFDTVAVRQTAGTVSLLKDGETADAGIRAAYTVSGGYLAGGSGLTLLKANDTAAVKSVPVTLVLTDANGNVYRKTVSVILPADENAVARLTDAIAARYTGSSDVWTVMDMAVYGALDGKTAKTTQEARQNALNLLIAEAASSTASAGDRARIEIVLRAMGIDSTRLTPFQSTVQINNAQKLAEAAAKADHYAAPYILLADMQGNVKLTEAQTGALIGLLSQNMGDGLFGYEWGGVRYSDPDTAGAALAALAGYYDSRSDAKTIADKILGAVPGALNDQGSLGNANSDAMMILGLVAMGKDPAAYRNAETGASLVDGLLSYVNASADGFLYAGADNALATEQGFRALLALARFDGNAYNLYDFSGNRVEPGQATGKGEPDQPVGPPAGEKDITVTVSIQADNGDWMQGKTITVKQGSTVYHALLEALKGSGITQTGAETGYIKSMTKDGRTLAEFSQGINSGWLYKVNGRLPNVGITACSIEAGDAILFYYTGDWTSDSAAGGSWGQPEEGPQTGLPFTDIAGHWGAEAIQYVCGAGLMNGIGGSLFDPDGTLTRGMMATILHRMAGSPEADGKSRFSDVAEGSWYSDAVAWAAASGIVKGFEDGSFRPEQKVTREEIAVMLRRYADHWQLDTGKTADLSTFRDAGTVSDWAKVDLAWANAEGLITGKANGILEPGGDATRAEAATIIMRFCEGKAMENS